MKRRLIVGISGADGVCIGARLLGHLRNMDGIETHLVMTEAAERNLLLEGGPSPDEVRALADVCHDVHNLAATIASGSFITEGMIIAPCSMKSLAALVSGYTDNLLQRAADVCLKEGRRVVLIPREMPLGRIHLRNMLAASELGCVVVPPVLTFYNRPQSVMDHVDHIIAKSLMPFGIALDTFRPWEGR